jgi:hypothetical protein
MLRKESSDGTKSRKEALLLKDAVDRGRIGAE